MYPDIYYPAYLGDGPVHLSLDRQVSLCGVTIAADWNVDDTPYSYFTALMSGVTVCNACLMSAYAAIDEEVQS